MALAAAASGMTAAPAAAQETASHGLSFMTGFGPSNYGVVTLLYAVLIISLAVIAIIGALVLSGMLIRRAGGAATSLETVPLERSSSGLAFIYIGIAISFVILTGVLVWNYVVLAEVSAAPKDIAARIHVIGHQWWWEVRYDGEPAQTFTTADEIHVPVGKPVRIELTSSDVIHSFWVPALGGKMDTIPGQQNHTWLQADKPGIYRGQCTEFCGAQHAHMGLIVVADAPGHFAAWRAHQLEGPLTPHAESEVAKAAQGQSVFMHNCAVCHTVRGTLANGKVGPDLSHLMQRRTIAAGTLPNTVGNLSGWISNPQHIKPSNLMPTLRLSAADLNSLRDFLKTLQ
jgi:cytochrome c oxidase subunit 2